MASLALGFAPAAALAAGVGEDGAGFERTISVGANALELRVNPGVAAPGTSAVSGEGSVATALPGSGHLTLRVPYVVAHTPVVGTAQLAASYDLAREGVFLPNVAVVARVDLPTAPRARGARPGVRAIAKKKLGSGVFEAIHVESELWTDGPSLSPSYRALVGTTFRLRAATSGSLDFIAVRPSPVTGAAPENLAQLGLSHELAPHTKLHVGGAAGLTDSPNAFRLTLGIDHRF